MRRLAVAVLTALLVSACHTSSTPAGPSTTTSTPLPATWSGAGAAPASPLIAAGDHVVYLGGSADALHLIALDATTGAVSWQLPAAAPVLLAGQRASVLADGDAVLALETPTSLTSVDAKSGSVRWRATLPSPATGNPSRCGDDVCITVGTPAAAATPSVPPASVPEDATTTSLPPAAPPTAALVALDRDDGHVTTTGHEIGPAVVAVDSGNVLSIVGTDLVLASNNASQVVWRAPLAQIVSATVASDKLRWRAWPGPGDAWVVFAGTDSDTTLGTTVGVTGKGVIAWRAVASRPCPPLDGRGARDGDNSLPVLLCFGVPTSAVAALDPLTGTAAWQVDAPSIDNPAASVVRTSGRSWLFDVQPVPIEIDIAEGPRRPGDDITGGWCGTPDPVPCTVIGSPQQFPDAVPAFAGVTAAGWGAWIDDRTVKAIKLP